MFSDVPPFIKQLIKKQNRLHKNATVGSTENRIIQFMKYKQMRSKIISLVRKENRHQIQQRIDNNEDVWKVANSILKDCSPNEINIMVDGKRIEC